MKIIHDLQPIELQYYSLDERLNEANRKIMRLPELGVLRREFAGSAHSVPVCFGRRRMVGSHNVERYRKAVFRVYKEFSIEFIEFVEEEV